MATEVRDGASEGMATPTDRYLLVSLDSHVSPRVVVFRSYCEAGHLEEFDAFAASIGTNTGSLPGVLRPKQSYGEPTERSRSYLAEVAARYGDEDLNAGVERRLRDMDADGIVAEVIHHGGFNGQPVPFASAAVPANVREAELRLAGIRMYNRYLADWVAAAPERLIGLAHVPIWDVDAVVAEVEQLARDGFRAVNFPAPRPGLPSYNLPSWDPVWAVCSAHGFTLHTHSAFDLLPLDGPGATAIKSVEVHFYSRRGVWQMTCGGVFARFPELTLVLTEQESAWYAEAMATLDSTYFATLQERETPFIRELLPEPPSFYLRRNCYVGASFMSRVEAELAIDGDIWANMMWGRDYPHPEGTWPYTAQSMRKTFSGLPDALVRAILGETSLRVLDLDRDALLPIAARIGPTVEALAEPYAGAPEGSRFSMGFRERGPFS